MTNDGFHSYTYDAEGHITAVDGGQTASYVYNALNQRVQTTVGGAITNYVYNAAGQRVSEWNGTTHAQIKGKYYWGGKPVAYYANGAAHFELQDWLGTERMRTAYNGGVEGSFTSLPFGDGQGTAGADTDANHYAMLDHDTETDTDYAQFRQYANMQGRWLSPDPYSGSYSMTNPQSMNRYVYAGNDPLAGVDPSGLQICGNWCRSMEMGLGGGGGGGNPLDPGSGSGLSGMFSSTLLDTVCASNGCYNYDNSSFQNAMSNGYGTGLWDDEGNIMTTDPNTGQSINVGNVTLDLVMGGISTSQMQNGTITMQQSGTITAQQTSAPNNAASLTLLPSAPYLHQINKLMCAAVYQSCLLGVGLANLECNIEKHLPASPISPVSPILCGDPTKQLEQAECSRQLESCMSNSGGDGDDKVLPNL